MDEKMEVTFEEQFLDSEFDIEYEFDAARYFDFTRPESLEEAELAELWFEFIGSYPPSPFVIKLSWEDIAMEDPNTSPKSNDCENENSASIESDISKVLEVSALGKNNADYEESERRVGINLPSGSPHLAEDDLPGSTKALNCHDTMVEGIPKGGVKSIKSRLSRSSTLMKPTASVLAKQNQPRGTDKLFRRFPNPSGIDFQATKRQRLETGYLRKVANLNHQTLLSHKVSKKKVTIPREPELETANRACRHRFKYNTESSDHTKANSRRTFKARPLNRKILEAPSLPIPKRSMPQLPEFQVFHLKTSERALQHQSDDVVNLPYCSSTLQNESSEIRRPNSADALMLEKSEMVQKFKGSILRTKEFKRPSDKIVSHDPPIELFNKLSLTSEAHSNTISRPKQLLTSKDSKENAPRSINQEHEMMNILKEKQQRFGGKQMQCGVERRTPKIGSRLKMNRSLGIQ